MPFQGVHSLTNDNPGRRFACPGLSTPLGFQPALAKQETSAPLLSGENGAYKPTQDGLIPHFYFIDRAVFYTSRAVSNQAPVGEWDYHLTPVFTVCFMNFVAFGKKKGESRGRKKEYDAPFRVDMILADEKTGKRLSDKMHFSFLQLPVFQKEEDECENDFERWIYILNNMETFQRMPFLAQNAVFRKLAEISDISTLSKEEHKKYDESIKRYRDTMAVINYAVKEGKEEVALNMLKRGMSIADIAACTGFTEEELAKLFNMDGTQPLA